MAGCTLLERAGPLPPVTEPPIRAVVAPALPETPTVAPTVPTAVTAPTPAAPLAARATIRLGAWGSSRTLAALDRALPTFKKQEPSIEVVPDLDATRSPDAAFERLRAADQPDVERIAPEDVFNATAGGLLYVLNPLYTRDMRDDLFAAGVRAARPGPGGEMGVVSLGAAYLAVFYNVLQAEAAGIDVPASWAAGWDIDTFETTARRMLVGSREQPDRFGLAMVAEVTRPWMTAATGPNPAGAFFSADESTSTLASVEHAGVLRRLMEWQTKLTFELPVPERFPAAFNGGLVSFYVDFSDFAPAVRSTVDWALAPLPGWNDRSGFSLANELCFGIGAASKQPEAAWRLLRFLLEPDGQAAFTRADAMVPFRREILGEPAFREPNRMPRDRGIWVDAVQRAVQAPSNPASKAWHVATGPLINPVRSGEVTVEAYLAQADTLITRQLRARDWSATKNRPGYRQPLPALNLRITPSPTASPSPAPGTR